MTSLILILTHCFCCAQSHLNLLHLLQILASYSYQLQLKGMSYLVDIFGYHQCIILGYELSRPWNQVQII
ncbi:hypothetical protein NMG60_11021533 [Bertholletia excelsa]